MNFLLSGADPIVVRYNKRLARVGVNLIDASGWRWTGIA